MGKKRDFFRLYIGKRICGLCDDMEIAAEATNLPEEFIEMLVGSLDEEGALPEGLIENYKHFLKESWLWQEAKKAWKKQKMSRKG